MFSPSFFSFLGKRKEASSESEASSVVEEEQDDIESMADVETEMLHETNVKIDNNDDDDDDSAFEESVDPPQAEFDPSTATLSQLLTRIIPDADIHCPNVVIVGGQSSGKTKMIISMVFHHLIENSSVTDEMGEKLLKIFRTGEKMVTRRPTKIQFVKTASGSPCSISLSLGNKSARFTEPVFDDIINSVHMESQTRDGKAFGGELKVTIEAPDLPNMTFTDLPGLITEDRAVCGEEGEEGTSIRRLVRKYILKLNTTLVVVEPASTEDFETSQVAPLLKQIREDERPHIFQNAVLVLSKCDKIRQGLEGRIMKIIDLTSPSLADYPFKHVVGVVNKIETPNDDAETELSFAEFKVQFSATKQHEKTIFANFIGQDGAACNRSTQCTTAAVFHQMDHITFDSVHRSIERGMESIDIKVKQLELQMREELAPPLSYYDKTETNTTGRAVIFKSWRDSFKKLLCLEFKGANMIERIESSRAAFLKDVCVDWPENHSCVDMYVSQTQTSVLEATFAIFSSEIIGAQIRGAFVEVLEDRDIGCFAGIQSRFHRIDRFDLLVKALTEQMMKQLRYCLREAKQAVRAYIDHFNNFEVPKGVSQERFGRLFDELLLVSIRKSFETLRAASKNEALGALFDKDDLFEENEEFIVLRDQLHARWDHLRQQRFIIARCKQVTSNEDLRHTLQEGFEDNQAHEGSFNNWHEFWKKAEQLEREAGSKKVRPPPTSMFSRAHSSQVSAASQPHEGPEEEASQVLEPEYEPEPEQSSMELEAAVQQYPHHASSQQSQASEPDRHRATQHSDRENSTPFKRMKATHEAELTPRAAISTSSADAAMGWASYGSIRAAPTFVTGSLFAGTSGAGSPAASSPRPAQTATGVLDRVSSYLSWQSPTAGASSAAVSASAAAPKDASSSGSANRVAPSHHLYRPDYSTAYNTTSSPSGQSTASHQTSTPGIVKREPVYYASQGSREAKGSPDDLIDLTE